MEYGVGDKIYFAEERYPYTIQACDERYLICTKPFNPKHTVQYTIVDLKEGIRGADKDGNEVTIVSIVADQYKYDANDYPYEKYEFFRAFENMYKVKK